MRASLPALLKSVNTIVEAGAADGVEERARLLFGLRQDAQLESKASLELLFCLLISSKGEEDLKVINPFLSERQLSQLSDLTVAAILHASRVGQTNRTISDAQSLLSLLTKPAAADALARSVAAMGLSLRGQTLAEGLSVRRHYMQPSVALRGTVRPDERGALFSFDPRFLLFEFTHNLVREAQVELVRELSTRCAAASRSSSRC